MTINTKIFINNFRKKREFGNLILIMLNTCLVDLEFPKQFTKKPTKNSSKFINSKVFKIMTTKIPGSNRDPNSKA